MLKLAIAGANGRMGRMLVAAVQAAPDCTLHAAFEAGDDAAAALRGADVLIDFTVPLATLAHLALCADTGVAAVVGTTGFDAAQKALIQAHAQRTAIVWAPNMSVGVNVLLALVQQAAQALGPGYDIEVLEMHHRHKVDAPSGTALALGEAAAAGRNLSLAEHAVYARQGHTGARPEGAIGFATLRGGDTVGDHTVLFAGTGERLELTHRSSSRANYAEGSLRAARFLAPAGAGRRAPGLYGMADVLKAAAR